MEFSTVLNIMSLVVSIMIFILMTIFTVTDLYLRFIKKRSMDDQRHLLSRVVWGLFALFLVSGAGFLLSNPII